MNSYDPMLVDSVELFCDALDPSDSYDPSLQQGFCVRHHQEPHEGSLMKIRVGTDL